MYRFGYKYYKVRYVPWSKKKTVYPGEEKLPKESAPPRNHKD